MADEQLLRRVERLRQDFEAERGSPFRDFFCPILHVDEPAELCKGHVIPEAFETSNAWLPQRKDIDNFYGTAAEAAFVAIVEDRGKHPVEMWLDPKLRKKHRPRIEYEGRALELYFPKQITPVPGQTLAEIVDQDGQKICNIVLKLTAEEFGALHGKGGEIVIDRDYRPAVIASLLKAAHLTLFRMLGYRHVFSPTGIYLADILATFYRQHGNKRRDELEPFLESHFRPNVGMVAPLIHKDSSVFQGTISDNRLLGCVGSSEGIFALGVIVKAGNDTFCVFLPTDDGLTINTYFNFLKEPPPSIAARLIQFVPGDSGKESHWATSKEEPLRIPLGQSLPVK